MRIAVVFDKSGTILRPCRVVLDIEKNELFFHVNTLKFVMEAGGYLVNIKGTSAAIKRGETNLGMKISCASSSVVPKVSKEVLKNGKTLDALRSVMFEAERHCGSDVGTCAALIVNKMGQVTHAVGLGGRLYEDVRETVEMIKKSDDDVFIATGNCKEATLKCARMLGINRRFVLHDASPKDKRDFIKMLRGFYGVVIMVGNDINDLLAMREADMSILVKRDPYVGVEELRSEVDYVVNSLIELPKIISEIKRCKRTN